MYSEQDLKDLALYLYYKGYANFSSEMENYGYHEDLIKQNLLLSWESSTPGTIGAVMRKTLYLAFSCPFKDLHKLLNKTKYVSKEVLTWRLTVGI